MYLAGVKVGSKLEMTSLNIFAEAQTESDLLASEVGIDNVEAFGRMLAEDESHANRRRALVLS
jgi:hypothetical protein